MASPLPKGVQRKGERERESDDKREKCSFYPSFISHKGLNGRYIKVQAPLDIHTSHSLTPRNVLMWLCECVIV